MGRREELIAKGQDLRGTELGSPRFDIWANDVREFVRPFGSSMMTILEGALQSGVVYADRLNLNDDAIANVNVLLDELGDRTPEGSMAQDAVINQQQATAKATLSSKFGSINIQGDATFGNDSPITKITVSELMAGLIKEVEEMPETDDKNRILNALKSIASNPTFATISGAGIGEIVKKLIGS